MNENNDGLLERWEIEEHRYTEEIDWPYVLAVASDVALTLREGSPAELAFQPGDGSRYALVFVPLWRLVPARPRIFEGKPWSKIAVDGVSPREGAALICQVEGGPSYPLRLHPRGVLSIDYVAEHWGATGASAVILTALFRGVARAYGKLVEPATFARPIATYDEAWGDYHAGTGTKPIIDPPAA